jgi:hypothetical protein
MKKKQLIPFAEIARRLRAIPDGIFYTRSMQVRNRIVYIEDDRCDVESERGINNWRTIYYHQLNDEKPPNLCAVKALRKIIRLGG